MASTNLDNLVSVAEAIMSRNTEENDDAGNVPTPAGSVRRRSQRQTPNGVVVRESAVGTEDVECGALEPGALPTLSAQMRRTDFSNTSRRGISIPGFAPVAFQNSNPLSTIGKRSNKGKFSRNVVHEADEELGGESGEESDLEDDEDFLAEVKEKSKGMMMYRAAKQSIHLDHQFKKLQSWDLVLLDLVRYERATRDIRDVKFSLGHLLRHHSADPDVVDELGNTPLHYAARRGNLEAVEMLLQAGAKLDMKNCDRMTPLLQALENNRDEVAARIMTTMRPARVRDIFIAHGEENCKFSFHKLIRNSEMTASLTAALNAMVKRLNDHPNSCKFFFQILDADENGRCPRDDNFDGKRTALQLIAKTGNKTAVYHNVVRILLWSKWKEFAAKKYWMQAAFFIAYVMLLTFALITGGSAMNPIKYDRPVDIARAVAEVLVLLFCLYGLAAEANQLYKNRRDYFEDGNNYVDLTAFGLFPLVVLPLRYSDSQAQWTLASFGYIATCLRFFKYTCAFRSIGAYTQILVKVVRQDIVRFMIIFCIFLVTFAGSFFLALRGEQRFNTVTNMTTTDLDLSYHTQSYPEILLTGLRIMIESGPIISYYEESTKLGWLGIVLILCFMFIVIVVLLNILIAQLSDTYQNVQSDAQREVELNRAYIVGHVEKNSLLYKNILRKNYCPYLVVKNPVDVLERWESPPINELHKNLHHMAERFEHYDLSLLAMEQTQSHQVSEVKDLKSLVVAHGLLIENLLKEVKKGNKRRRRKRKKPAGEGEGELATDASDTTEGDGSDTDTQPGAPPHLAHQQQQSSVQASEEFEDDELGGVRHGQQPLPARLEVGLLQSGRVAAAAIAAGTGKSLSPPREIGLQRRGSLPTVRTPSYEELVRERRSTVGSGRGSPTSLVRGIRERLSVPSGRHHSHPPAQHSPLAGVTLKPPASQPMYAEHTSNTATVTVHSDTDGVPEIVETRI